MKKRIISITIVVFMAVTGMCFAESGIPDLVGTWAVKAEGGVINKSGADGNKTTHHSADFDSIAAEAVIVKQQGRVLHGKFTSAKATESFIAVIGMDNNSFFFADEDGFLEGKMVGKNKINVVYRHVTANDIVVGVGTWTRKK